ncbi:hypothetical protein BJ944DRAFT_206690 [Cunninghamella echinulata]|nr:hypothetical protein BJ944DRAFT_206690 [Cunninghamella echinulata]
MVYGTIGILLGAAVSALAMYLANLARNPLDPIPVQVNSSVVLAVFLFLGIFVVNYIRMYFPKANFGCIFGCVMLTISLTTASSTPGFQPAILYAIFIPVSFGTAISLAVNVLVWPEDSMTSYINMLCSTLDEYNNFFKEFSDAFLNSLSPSLKSSLPELRARMNGSLLLLIDSKRNAQREIQYSYLSGKDCSKITRIVKELRAPLHGIGLSFIKKQDLTASLHEETNTGDHSYISTYPVTEKEIDAFNDSLNKVKQRYEEVGVLCQNLLKNVCKRASRFGCRPRSTVGTIWFLPRFNIFNRHNLGKDSIFEDEERSIGNDLLQLEKLLAEMDTISLHGFKTFLEVMHDGNDNQYRYFLLYILFCYHLNLKLYAKVIIKLVNIFTDLEHKRTSKQIWLPKMSLKKWFRASKVDTEGTDDIGDGQHDFSSNGLVRTSTKEANDYNIAKDNSRMEKKHTTDNKHKQFPMDPDVYPPNTRIEQSFYYLHEFKKWCTDINTFFAFKTGVAVVLLAIPAFQRENAAWFLDWKGQWAQISLVLWLFPMAGLSYASMIFRLAGTVFGGIIGIIVWEITRGNPYGIAVLTFSIVVYFKYKLFFGAPYMRPISLLTIVTMMLVVVYEYSYVQDNINNPNANYDKVYVVAGKRVLLVSIGLFAATILNMIPTQVTGRVELRKQLATIITKISKLYSILSSDYIINTTEHHTKNQKKAFRKLFLDVQRHIADSRTLLAHSKFEPPLRGRFPSEEYTVLLQKVENMTDLVQSMTYATVMIDVQWRNALSTLLINDRKDYLASIIISLKLSSTAFSAKTPFPPFLLDPAEARNKFLLTLEKKIRIHQRDLTLENINNHCAYGTYVLASISFVSEVHGLQSTVKSMVGVDDPFAWRENHK